MYTFWKEKLTGPLDSFGRGLGRENELSEDFSLLAVAVEDEARLEADVVHRGVLDEESGKDAS